MDIEHRFRQQQVASVLREMLFQGQGNKYGNAWVCLRGLDDWRAFANLAAALGAADVPSNVIGHERFVVALAEGVQSAQSTWL